MNTAQGQITKLAAVLMAASFDGIAEERAARDAVTRGCETITARCVVRDVVVRDVTEEPAKMGKSSPEPLQIVVSIPERKLALVQGGHVQKLYDVAVGKPCTPTPQGKFVVINRIPHPTWYGPQGPVPPGKNNPVGTRWMGLSKDGYGIHGTNAPSSIGHAASHGCIRMRQQDLEELFDVIPVGTTVEIETVGFDELDAPAVERWTHP
jgi:lipoprotein-anchoring transpeptidase ErfK/SrfK